jgi:hypothetical protein
VKGLRKKQKLSVTIANVPPEIRTAHLPNTSLECYRYVNLLGAEFHVCPESLQEDSRIVP